MDLKILRPHEMVDSSRILELLGEILRDGVIRYPILVDSKTLTILDGHHRVEVARMLSLKFIPALLVDYDSNCVTVSSWRDGVTITKDMVRIYGLRGELMPPKTSRHRVCFEIPEVNMALEVLRG